MQLHVSSTAIQQTVYQPDAVITLLSNYLAKVESGEKVNAVLHPNGYIKCVLKSDTDGSRIRLHMWDSKIGGFRDPAVHNHCWDFTSQILLGTITEEIYEVHDTKTKESAWTAYTFTRDNEKRVLSELGEAEPTIAQIYAHGAGTVYARHHETLHRITSAEGFTATLVHEGPTVRTVNQVFMKHGAEPATITDLTYQTAPSEILKNALVQLIQGLKVRSERF